MNLKRIMLFVFVIFFMVLLSGCSSNKEDLKFTDKSKVVLITDSNAQALVFTTFLENETNKASESFYVEYEINNEVIGSKLEQTKFIVGEDIVGDKGKLYSIKASKSLQIGGTMRLTERIDEKELKEIIENEKAVKVTLLNENKETIKTDFIQNFNIK